MKKIVILLFVVFSVSALCQDMEIEVYDPFVTSYVYSYVNCMYTFDDMVIYHPNWGVLTLGSDANNEIVETGRLYTDYYFNAVRSGDYFYTANWYKDLYGIDEDEMIRLQKIDISDPTELVFADELELELPAEVNQVHVLGEKLYVMVPQLTQYCVINLASFAVEGYYNYLGGFNRAVGNYIIGYTASEQFYIYESGTDSLELVTTGLDLSSAHQNQGIANITMLSDNIACSAGSYNLVIWDISDITNWEQLTYWEPDNEELLNNNGIIVQSGNKLFLNSIETLFELETDENYAIISETDHTLPFSMSAETIGILDNTILIPGTSGIARFNIADGNFEYLGYLGYNSLLRNHNLFADDYFVFRSSMFDFQGIERWDVSNPRQPQFLELLLGECNYQLMESSHNLFCFNGNYETYWDFYRYAEEEMQFMLQVPYESNYDIDNYALSDRFEEDCIYTGNQDTYRVRKYQFADDELSVVIDSVFWGEKFCFIREGKGYFITDENCHDLLIYSGFEDNEPVLSYQYDDFVAGEDCFLREINSNYFAAAFISGNTIIYGIDNEGLTGQTFGLTAGSSGHYIMIEDYLICFDGYYMYFYQIDENTSSWIDPVQYQRMDYCVTRLIYRETEAGEHFIFCFGFGAISVMELTITNGVLTTEIADVATSVYAYPNPVYPNRDGQVKFETTGIDARNGIKGELFIYNIKGQLINQQKFDLSRDISISWNCHLKNGSKAPTGVYLYKVDTGEKLSVGKFIITK